MKPGSKTKKSLTRIFRRRPNDEPKKKEETSSANESPVPTQPKEPDTDAVLSNQDIDPWMQAYQILEARQPKLTADFRKHLASLQGGTASSADLSSPSFVKAVIENLLGSREDKQWSVSLLSKDIKIRQQAEKLVKFFLWTDPFIQKAVSAQPHAALAWCGVSLLLPVGKGLS